MSTKLYTPGEDIVLPVRAPAAAQQPQRVLSTPTPAPRARLTAARSPRRFALDTTAFAPTALVMLSGGAFAQRYAEQLRASLSHDSEDTETLLALAGLLRSLRRASGNVQLVSARSRKLLPAIARVLNAFLDEHEYLLHSVGQMLEGGEG